MWNPSIPDEAVEKLIESFLCLSKKLAENPTTIELGSREFRSISKVSAELIDIFKGHQEAARFMLYEVAGKKGLPVSDPRLRRLLDLLSEIFSSTVDPDESLFKLNCEAERAMEEGTPRAVGESVIELSSKVKNAQVMMSALYNAQRTH